GGGGQAVNGVMESCRGASPHTEESNGLFSVAGIRGQLRRESGIRKPLQGR
ncbi:hypothetical protein CDAR_268131, partial [Caerostris darwini]